MINEIYPHRLENHYQANMPILDDDFLIYFKGNTVLLKQNSEEPELIRKRDLEANNELSESVFLYQLDGFSCFLLLEEPILRSEFIYKELNIFRTMKHVETAWAILVAFHLYTWYAEHRYCGKCGTKAQHKADERAMQCPDCGALFFPKISPAIIVAITCGDKILLARNSNFPTAWYALVAGYVDVAESLEETVIREVKEEVGLDIKNVRYFMSQPWPLTASMMVGFVAEADAAQEIQIDGLEIAEAAWFTRGNLPNYPPAQLSISGLLIEKFENGEL